MLSREESLYDPRLKVGIPMSKIRNTFLACAAVLGVAACGGAASGAELVDMVVATVGPEVILYSEVMDEIQPLLVGLQSTARSREAFERERDKAVREGLDQAIEMKILYREAQFAGMQISDEAVEERLDKIRRQYRTSEEFLKLLEESGETISDVRQRMRKQIMAITMGMRKRQDFEREAVISESDMAAYYQEHLDAFIHPERVRARRIFLGAEGDADARAQVRARLDALRGEIVNGLDFAVAARMHSEGPDAAEGGNIGWVSRGDLVPVLEEAAFALEAGGLSPVIETEFGFHLMKVDVREAPGQASYEEARTEIEPILRAQTADERYRKWMDELRKRSRVRIML